MLKPFILLMTAIQLIGCITYTQEDFIQPRDYGYKMTQAPLDSQLTEHSFTRPDNTIAYGVSFTKPNNDKALLYYGGSQWVVNSPGAFEKMQVFIELGFDVYMFDHRGYGQSTGVPNVDNMRDDAVLTYDFIRNLVDKPLVVHGHSLGGFEAAFVASQRNVETLVLEATATSVPDWVNAARSFFPFNLLHITVGENLQRVDNVSALAKHNGKLVVIVGDQDSFTPPALSEKLFELAPTPMKKLVVIEGGEHTNLKSLSSFGPIYQQSIN